MVERGCLCSRVSERGSGGKCICGTHISSAITCYDPPNNTLCLNYSTWPHNTIMYQYPNTPHDAFVISLRTVGGGAANQTAEKASKSKLGQ